MRVAHVHATIEKLLGQTVSKDSVSWCLSTGVRGKEPQFERVAYGCYRLLRPLPSTTGVVRRSDGESRDEVLRGLA